jgi:putative ABC transport system ATP-binding protein
LAGSALLFTDAAFPRVTRAIYTSLAGNNDSGIAMTALVSLRNVTKSYVRGKQKVEVLHGVDLEIATGEFLALMGPSGSGKTTMLNLIAGLDQPTSGEVAVAGDRIDRLSRAALANWRARHIGFIFQFYNLLPVLTAEANVEVPLLLTNLSKVQRRRRVQTVLQLVGLADRARHKPNELSGGQQQRVAIARAIVADPTLLVCDEPTGDLDRQNAEEIMNLLQALNRSQGKTIVMVTHDPKAAEYASRELHLDKGKLTRDAARRAA